MNLYDLKTVPTKNNTRKLLYTYKYKNIIVPKDFETNGADVPRIFWIVLPPFKPKYEPAYMVHDYMIKEAKKIDNKELRWASIRIANKTYIDIISSVENNKTFIKIMYSCLKAYWNFRNKFNLINN